MGNGQPGEPALCQLYRHTFVPCKNVVVVTSSSCDVTLVGGAEVDRNLFLR